MEYSLAEGRTLEELVAVLNAQAIDGWELASAPAYSQATVRGRWFAIVRRAARRATDKG